MGHVILFRYTVMQTVAEQIVYWYGMYNGTTNYE